MLALLCVCRASLGPQFQTLASIADPLVAQFGFSYTEVGTLLGLFMLPGLVLSLPAGAGVNHLPRDELLLTFVAAASLPIAPPRLRSEWTFRWCRCVGYWPLRD